MHRDRLSDLAVFLAVVADQSFTQAAARLGTSQSAVSNAVARLEAALGLRLLNRTTRKVSPTQAGARLAEGVSPCFDTIAAQVASLSTLRDTPSGLVRIATSERAAETVLWPKLSALMAEHPAIQVELVVDSRFTDIVGDGFDAGVRLGESIDQDMIAVRIGPDMRMALVGSPAYLDRAGVPEHPRDLLQQSCINLRQQTRGNLYVWEFAQTDQALNVRVDGPLTFNMPTLCVAAACDGHGLTYLPEDHVAAPLADGRLRRVMEDWSQPFAGYHLYYPNRRQTSPAMALVIARLRWPAAAEKV